MKPAITAEFTANGKSRQLVLLIHGYSSRVNRLSYVAEVIHRSLPDADILKAIYPVRRFSTIEPEEIVKVLIENVDQCWADRGRQPDGLPYERILLVGHSLGALLARKIYVCACGENDDAPLGAILHDSALRTDSPRIWAVSVERIVLLAGMNRGWSISSHMAPKRVVEMWIGAGIGNLMMLILRRPPLIFTVRRGAPFITQLRLQWLSMLRHSQIKGVGRAATIQILGSVDDIVSPQDNLDLVTGAEFIYLDVPQSGHASVVDMDDTEAGKARADVFRQAITNDVKSLKEVSVTPGDDVRLVRPQGANTVTDVVFVIHGIRDQGYWTQKIAREVQRVGRANGRTFAVETSTYGYFAMLPFILPWKRRAKVHWLMDRYIENLALYGEDQRPVPFSFVGHSNGTYLLAQALKEYPACRFQNVVFAGSVVNTAYNWADAVSKGRIKRLLNYVATADWVVAIFPKAAQTAGLRDLGSAGHDGFELPVQSSLNQIEFVKGGHSAAIQEDNWSAIADFIVTGEVKKSADLRPRRSAMIVGLGRCSLAIWAAIFFLIFLGGFLILRLCVPGWLVSLLMVLYAWIVWTILTKF